MLRYGLNDWGSIPSRGKIFFSIPQSPHWFCDPPSLLSHGYRGGGSLTGANRPGLETDHSPPSSVEDNYGSAIPPFPFTSSWSDAMEVQLDAFLTLSVDGRK
jgi:hypothetical protein